MCSKHWTCSSRMHLHYVAPSQCMRREGEERNGCREKRISHRWFRRFPPQSAKSSSVCLLPVVKYVECRELLVA